MNMETHQPMIPYQLSTDRTQLSNQELEEGWLANAIGSDDGYPGVEIDTKVHALEQRLLAGEVEVHICKALSKGK